MSSLCHAILFCVRDPLLLFFLLLWRQGDEAGYDVLIADAMHKTSCVLIVATPHTMLLTGLVALFPVCALLKGHRVLCQHMRCIC